MLPQEHERALKKMRIGSLDPRTREEVVGLVRELGYESAVSGSTSLHLLLRLYKAGREKEKGRRKALEKAEEMIMRLSSLHYEAHEREMRRKREERKGRPRAWGEPVEMPISRKAKEIFESLGISDERVMAHVIDFLGEKKLEDRAETVSASKLDERTIKAVFGGNPELLLRPDDSDFVSELEGMEAKKSIIDNRYAELGMSEPVYLRYPEILTESYHEVARIMELHPVERPEPAALEEERRQKLRVAPIRPDDFIKVLRGLGFELKSSGPHRVLAHEDGRVSVVQSGHGANKEFGAGLIRMKLRESGISVEEFERKRGEMGL